MPIKMPMERIQINTSKITEAIHRSRRNQVLGKSTEKKRSLEGGCGVIGIIGSDKLGGRCIIRPCEQMRNRGNGKGGGVAAVGLFDEYKEHYALHISYLDEDARGSIEKEFVESVFDISHAERQQSLEDYREVGLEVKPPLVWRYFVRAKTSVLEAFVEENEIPIDKDSEKTAAEDECVFQNSFRLNARYYEGRKDPQAFVLSHGRDLLILKGVGYAEEIARYYMLEETKAHLWIGHQRYPTRGRVWHPGGAHPFVGLHEALVHNGDFANYHSVCEYLRQWGIVPQFITDTEVSVLLFDLYSRVLGYPLEFVIEALAPTPEGDFERLTKQRQRIFRAIQSAHLHGSPDGPWFFIVARAERRTGAPQLIGITDVSMLRPQVFSLHEGEKSYGAIASEKQAIDAFFEEIASEDPSIPPMADRYWVARGGSCTDGGAFIYTLKKKDSKTILDVRDKFGNRINGISPLRSGEEIRTPTIDISCPMGGKDEILPPHTSLAQKERTMDSDNGIRDESMTTSQDPFQGILSELIKCLQADRHEDFKKGAKKLRKDEGNIAALKKLTLLHDRRWDPGEGQRSFQQAAIESTIYDILDSVSISGNTKHPTMVRLDASSVWEKDTPRPQDSTDTMVLDAGQFPNEGPEAVCRAVAESHAKGWKNFILYRCRGDRFIGCGLGSNTEGVRIDVFGSSGDYLGSGLDGAQLYVHGDAQDQVGQILKSGRIVIFGNVGQTFLYGAKGGETFVLGSAAGRPLINAVGCVRAIINGSCLDYCAESFMAGAQTGGGFVIINGLTFDERGEVIGLETKYPGNNLFSLASGGACYLNDPYHTVTESQLNGAEFTSFRREDWITILPYLQENGRLFGISIRHDLLMVDGVLKWPEEVFRKIIASRETHELDWTSLD
ncbi:MAG: glutamate synthase [Candidatus Aminicenantes bacterium]|jgi:glutamate synthase domain-containing protein 1/glutamate synthase domain-containing protein 3